MAKPTWFSIDLPVLDAIVTYLEEKPDSFPQLNDIAAATGIDVEEVGRAAKRLEGRYIELHALSGPGRGHWFVTSVTTAAREATGQWPNAESIAAEIIRGIERRADEEADQAEQKRLRQAAAVLGSTAKDITTGVLSAVIIRHMGMG